MKYAVLLNEVCSITKEICSTIAKEDEQVYCTVRADEIPEEPGKSFLMRDFEEPEIEEDIKGKDEAKEKNSISRR